RPRRGRREGARPGAEPAARERLYRRLEALLAEDARVVPLFHDLDCRVVGARLRNVRLRGTLPYVGDPEVAISEWGALPAQREDRRGVLLIPVPGSLETLDPART